MSKPTHKDELPSVDLAALAQVTGGAGENSALLGQLTGILDSIKSVRNVSQENGINPQEMMLFMMLMQQRNQQQTTQVVQQIPWWSQGGWPY